MECEVEWMKAGMGISSGGIIKNERPCEQQVNTSFVLHSELSECELTTTTTGTNVCLSGGEMRYESWQGQGYSLGIGERRGGKEKDKQQTVWWWRCTMGNNADDKKKRHFFPPQLKSLLSLTD